jgi:hypothetical protein
VANVAKIERSIDCISSQLTISDIFVPIPVELRAVAAEVSNKALTKAITVLKETVVSSRYSRYSMPTRKHILNKVAVEEGFSK